MQPLTASIPDSPGAPFYRTIVDTCVRGVVETLGADEIEALLLIGAPARGEPTVVEAEGGPYSLSDVDLVCIARPGADPALRARLRRWVADANEELAPVCAGVDVGLKRKGDLAGFQPFLTTFEMLRSPVVVWGDASVLDGLPPIAIADIPAWDSLRLVNNRLVDGALLSRRLSRPNGTMMDALSGVYTACKLTLDVATAFLVLERDVPERYTDRVSALRDRAALRPDNDAIRIEVADRLQEIEAAAHFKASGDVRALATAFDAGADADGIAAASRACLKAHSGLVEAVWRWVLERVSGGSAVGVDLEDAAVLYSRLEPLPKKVVRAWRLLRAPAGRAGLFSARRVAALAPFASPRELGYVVAAAVYLETTDRTRGDVAWPLIRRYCPFSLPSGYWGLGAEERRVILLDRLDLFLRTVLHGREVPTGT